MADQVTTIRLSFPVLYQELGMRTILATDGTCVLKAGYIAPVADPVTDGPRFTAVLFTVPGGRGRLPRGEVGGGNGKSLDELAEHLRQRLAERGPWWKAAERTCEMDGTREDTHGAEHYWNCARPGTVDVEGKLLCEDHAGELGYGPKQEEYGFDPNDGLNPTPDLAAQLTEWIKAEGIEAAATAPVEIVLGGAKGAGRVALIDAQDYELVSAYRWHAAVRERGRPRANGPYAQTSIKRDGRVATITMHKLITGWEQTDHIDHDGLNNQRSNLRPATNRQNMANSRKAPTWSSPYKGVCWVAAKGRWRATIKVRGKSRHLGYFEVEEDAARAYNEAAIEAHGSYANPNEVGA